MTKSKSSSSTATIVQLSCFLVFLIALVLVERIPTSEAASSSSSAPSVAGPPNRNFIHIQPEQHHHQQYQHSQPSGRSTSSNSNSNNQHHQHHQHHQRQPQPEPVADGVGGGGKQRNVAAASSGSSVRYSLSDEGNTAAAAAAAGVETSRHQDGNPSGLPDDAFLSGASQQHPNQHIFINQSNNIYILAKYGQMVYLPCVVFKQKHFDLSNVHVIWHRLYERSRPVVLSIGMQQLKQDMRYRVKVQNLSKSRSSATSTDGEDGEPLAFDSAALLDRAMVKRDELNATEATTTTTVDPRDDYLIQNWQFEIRKLTFDDAGTYQCLLPLVKPISRNITLQVIPDLTIEPRENGNYKVDDKIVLRCRATMRTLHKTPSMHLIHQRQSKSSILWYKENDIIKSTTVTANDENEAESSSLSAGARNDGGENGEQHKIEIETKLDNNEQTLNSILTISHAREADSGQYRCIYDNIQENVQVKVINDHYEYKKYLSSVSSSSSSASSATSRFQMVAIFFLFISTATSCVVFL